MKQLWIIGLLMLMSIGLVSAFSGSGSGTVNDPYQVTTAEQFDEINDDVSASYKLMNNIDLSMYNAQDLNGMGFGFWPIGMRSSGGCDWTTNFRGTLDGNGKSLTGLFIEMGPSGLYPHGSINQYGTALIACTDGAIIKNLNIVDANVTGISGSSIVVGEAWNTSIVNVTISGNLKCHQDYCGGVIATSYGLDLIENVVMQANVDGGYSGYTGGLVGYLGGSRIINSVSKNNRVTSTQGFSGDWAYGGDMVGGLVGYAEVSEIGDGVFTAPQITSSYAASSVVGYNYIGGAIGYVVDGNISYVYATSTTTALGDTIGGLIGQHDAGIINHVFAAGTLNTNGSTIGGLIASSGAPESVTEAYFDQETLGTIDSAAGIPQSTKKMKAKDGYPGWDFANKWTLDCNAYPQLKHFKKVASECSSGSSSQGCRYVMDANGNVVGTVNCGVMNNTPGKTVAPALSVAGEGAGFDLIDWIKGLWNRWFS